MGLPDFKALKERVGIDDVAYYLGYQVNRLAGVGRFIEMVLPDGNGGHSDSIVIREPQDKANQFYFRHKGYGKGDVIAFIQENINRFDRSRSGKKNRRRGNGESENRRSETKPAKKANGPKDGNSPKDSGPKESNNPKESKELKEFKEPKASKNSGEPIPRRNRPNRPNRPNNPPTNNSNQAPK